MVATRELDINELYREAQNRWLKPAEVLFLLQNYERQHLMQGNPQNPPSGSLFLFNRRVHRFFRKDGYAWRKKRDGKTVGEAHERLKVGNVDTLNCYYAHGEQNPNFQRRSYWMLDPAWEHIVLVHYREVGEVSSLNPDCFWMQQLLRIPGCAKSALCKEILRSPEALGDQRPMHSMMGDIIKGKYWQKVADERRQKPYSITLADKNAPNEEVWKQIEDMCRSTKASAVPVVPDTEGTDSNPFSYEALAVFIFRVLQRVNHPGNLDKASPNAGCVLLMFYHLYEGKSRREFESELIERFGSVVKMPLLKADRSPLPDPVKDVIEEGMSLYRVHTNRHGRTKPNKGSYAKEWVLWEKRLREILFGNSEHLNSIQVPFEVVVAKVLEQLRAVAKGEYKVLASTEKRESGNIVFCAVTLPVSEIEGLLDKLTQNNKKVSEFFKGKHFEKCLKKAHVTLAHKRSHGIAAVANYGVFLNQNVPVHLTALLFSDNMAAFEARLGSVDGEKLNSKNEWPHVTIWTGEGVQPKEANTLPGLHSEGKATLVEIKPPCTMTGVLEFY